MKWECFNSAAAAAKSLQLCPTLCDPIDGSPPGSLVPGILQARTLEWLAISFSNAWKWKVKVKLLSRTRLLGTPWTAALQAPPSMGFSRQEYWSGVPLPSPVLTLVYRKWGESWRVLSKAGVQMILLGGGKLEEKITRVKIRKLSQDPRHLIVKSQELGKLFQQKLSGCGDWLNEDVRESYKSKLKLRNFSVLSYMAIWIHFITLKRSLTNDSSN